MSERPDSDHSDNVPDVTTSAGEDITENTQRVTDGRPAVPVDAVEGRTPTGGEGGSRQGLGTGRVSVVHVDAASGASLPPFDVSAAVAACVAATGAPVALTPPQCCPVFPDGAHRCGLPATHLAGTSESAVEGRSAADHVCGCGFVWCSTSGGVSGLCADMEQSSRSGAERVVSRIVERLTKVGYDLTDKEWRVAAGAGGGGRSGFSPVEVVRQVARREGADL